jgi:hypothetical protein
MPPKKQRTRGSTKPATFRADSVQEVERLLRLQITLHDAAEKSPDSPSLQEQAKENMVHLRRSVHLWGEKTDALATRPMQSTSLSDQQELTLLHLYTAMVAQIESASVDDNKAEHKIESLKDSPELQELDKQANEFAKLFIEPDEAFATKKPLWKP